MHSLEFADGWNKYFNKLEGATKKRLFKKIDKLQREVSARHLRHGLPFFVVNVGQHRICFDVDDVKNIRTISFVGTHKDYKRWISEQRIRQA